ncbi:MAG: T9SS type A sorting domain-containing protein [Ignavibacteriales bacterium]|nr:T9SS type A sorting domain-containing protein [Ignavibacteriales bacterium]
MKNFLLVMILISAQAFAQYTTPNTGVNWNLDDLVTNSAGVVTGTFPNYAITNKITISTNDRVYINPGTTVLFSGSTSGFDIDGKFWAVGTQIDSIIFSSSLQDSLGNAYNGFYFLENSVDSACMISYARIEFAYYGFRCLNANPTLSNSYLWKCRRGVQLSSSSPAILSSVIERSYEYGITMTLGSSPLIEGNTLIKNNTQGTSAKNQISVGLQGNNSPIVRDNIIYGGSSIPTGGISLWVSGSTSFSDMIIEGNEIYNNGFGISLYSTSDGVINAVVKNNKIYNNNINPNALVSGSGINVNGSPFNTPIITQNEIYGNWWGITIQNGTTVQAGPNPNLGNIENADTTDDGQNIFYGNIQGIDTFDVYNNCTNDIYAQNNDWGVYDSTLIETHVYHKVDNNLHGLIKFMPFSASIPVELTSFTANVVEGNVVLNWITATELNNSGFDIEKSIDNSTWNKIGFVNGNGTSTEIHNYSFADQTPFVGTSYYRLKQIDFDGTTEYSNTIEVTFGAISEFALDQNYPNPFNPSTKINYSIKEKSNVELKIFDLLGSEIATLVNEEKSPGNYEVFFDASKSSSGVYLYSIKAGSFVQTRKMLLMK